MEGVGNLCWWLITHREEEPSGGFQGQASDIERHAKEILDLRWRLNQIYVKHSGQSLKAIEDALERDTFLTAEGARDFGLVDHVIEKRPEICGEVSGSPKDRSG